MEEKDPRPVVERSLKVFYVSYFEVYAIKRSSQIINRLLLFYVLFCKDR